MCMYITNLANFDLFICKGTNELYVGNGRRRSPFLNKTNDDTDHPYEKSSLVDGRQLCLLRKQSHVSATRIAEEDDAEEDDRE